jgi:hypothetical protein
MALKRGVYLALTALVAFLLAGCSFMPNQTQETPEIVEKIGGVEFYIEEGIAPEFAYNKEPFMLPIKIFNTGFQDSVGIISVKGRESYLEVQDGGSLTSSKTEEFALSGGSSLTSGAESKYLQFQFYPMLEERLESKMASVEISMCYSYSTVFKKTVCVDTIPYLADKAPVACRASTQSYGGQGSPLAITEIIQNAYIDTNGDTVVTYVITIQNMENGLIIPHTLSKNDSNNYCKTGNLNGNKMNVIEIEYAKIGEENSESESFICNGIGANSQELALGPMGVGTIMCKKTFPKGNYILPYSTVLELKINYGYYTNFVRPLEIIRRGNTQSGFNNLYAMY